MFVSQTETGDVIVITGQRVVLDLQAQATDTKRVTDTGMRQTVFRKGPVQGHSAAALIAMQIGETPHGEPERKSFHRNVDRGGCIVSAVVIVGAGYTNFVQHRWLLFRNKRFGRVRPRAQQGPDNQYRCSYSHVVSLLSDIPWIRQLAPSCGMSASFTCGLIGRWRDFFRGAYLTAPSGAADIFWAPIFR